MIPLLWTCCDLFTNLLSLPSMEKLRVPQMQHHTRNHGKYSAVHFFANMSDAMTICLRKINYCCVYDNKLLKYAAVRTEYESCCDNIALPPHLPICVPQYGSPKIVNWYAKISQAGLIVMLNLTVICYRKLGIRSYTVNTGS